MTRFDNGMYRKLLLSLRAQLRGDVNLLLDAALDVAISEPRPRPKGTCRTCRATWRTSVASSLRDFIERLIDRKEAMLYHVEKQCRVVVRLRPKGKVMIEQAASDFATAIGRAADRVKHTVSRALKRRGDTKISRHGLGPRVKSEP